MATMIDRLAALPVGVYAMQILTLAGVSLASHRLLLHYMASIALTPPSRESTPVVRTQGPSKRWYHLGMSLPTMLALGVMIVFGAVFVFVAFVLPRLSNDAVLNAFWSILCIFIYSTNMYQFSLLLYPNPTAVVLGVTGQEEKTYKILKHATSDSLPWHKRPRIRLAVSLLYASIVLVSAWQGHFSILALSTAIWVAVNLTNMTYSTVGIRSTVKRHFITLAGVVGFFAVMIGVWFIIERVRPELNKPQEDTGAVAKPSDWVMKLLTSMSWSWAFVPGGEIMSLTHRYEYSKTLSPRRTNAPAGVGVILPLAAPKFPMGLVWTTRLAIILASLASDALVAALLPRVIKTQESSFLVVASATIILNMFIVPLFVVVALSLHTWRTGEFKTWWTYEEVWVPNYEQENVITLQDEEDVEKALLVDYDNRTVIDAPKPI